MTKPWSSILAKTVLNSILDKPVRFGYKVWSDNTDLVYLCAFDVYQGKTFKSNGEIEKCLENVMLLSSSYYHPMIKRRRLCHIIFFVIFSPLFHFCKSFKSKVMMAQVHLAQILPTKIAIIQ